MRTFLGESGFYWPSMVLAEQWQCILLSNVLCQCPLGTEFCPYYVPSIFGKPTGYERTGPAFSEFGREQKMRTNFSCTNFLNTARGPGHPSKNPGTSQIPPLETQGRQTFEGGHELFGHHPFAPKTPTPPAVSADSRKGMRTATFQFSESGGSLNRPDLFTELPFL